MKIILVIFLCISSLLFSKENSLYVCTIFHNESRFLDEWVSFHLQQGVDKIYMYNNNSEDDYIKPLKKYVRSGKVIIVQWNIPHDTGEGWNWVQSTAYNDCIEKIKHHCNWCAFIDTDEFLFSPSRKSLKTILEDYEAYDAVGANWVMYGTSNVERIPDDENMIDLLVMRAPMTYAAHNHVKCIVKPSSVENFTNPHYANLKPGKVCVNENKVPFTGPFSECSVNILRINHYWTRDRVFFLGEKKERQKKWWDREINEKQECELNLVFDPFLSSYRN